MAEDTVDAAIKHGKLDPSNSCVTAHLPIVGAYGWDPLFFTMLVQSFVRLKRTHDGRVVPRTTDTATAKHLSCTYGSMAEHVTAIAQNENLGKRLVHGHVYLEAEVAYCARNEYCESVVDFLARRTRLAFLDADAASCAIPRVIEILAAEHGWDKARQDRERQDVEAFLRTFKIAAVGHHHDLV